MSRWDETSGHLGPNCLLSLQTVQTNQTSAEVSSGGARTTPTWLLILITLTITLLTLLTLTVKPGPVPTLKPSPNLRPILPWLCHTLKPSTVQGAKWGRRWNWNRVCSGFK